MVNWEVAIEGTAGQEGRIMAITSLHSRAATANGRFEDSWDYVVSALPLSASSSPPYTRLRYRATGAATSSHVSIISGRIWHSRAGYTPGDHVSTDWANAENPAAVLVELSP